MKYIARWNEIWCYYIVHVHTYRSNSSHGRFRSDVWAMDLSDSWSLKPETTPEQERFKTLSGIAICKCLKRLWAGSGLTCTSILWLVPSARLASDACDSAWGSPREPLLALFDTILGFYESLANSFSNCVTMCIDTQTAWVPYSPKTSCGFGQCKDAQAVPFCCLQEGNVTTRIFWVLCRTYGPKF